MAEERAIKRRKRTPTAKQVRFANLLASGKHTLVDAYCLSYATEKMTQTTRRNEASKLASNPVIAAMVETEKMRLTNIEAQAERQKSIQTISDTERVLSRLRLWLDNPPDSPLQLTLTLSTNPYPFHSPGFSVCLGFATPTPLVRVAHDISYT